MIPLTDEENKSYEEHKVCYICKKESSDDDDDDDDDDDNKMYQKVRDNCHYTGNYREATRYISNLRHKTPKEITIVFQHSTYNI